LEVLKAAGADTTYTGEGEVALAFVVDILTRLGATPEQIDRERARARQELFGAPTSATVAPTTTRDVTPKSADDS
jgi:CPA2 family monovalent cation:H+ antiporter-2